MFSCKIHLFCARLPHYSSAIAVSPLLRSVQKGLSLRFPMRIYGAFSRLFLASEAINVFRIIKDRRNCAYTDY